VISWGIGLVTNAVHPLGVLAAAASLMVFVQYAAALGVVCSMLSSSSERAVVAVFMALVASNAAALLFMPVDLIGSLAGTRQATVLAGLTPLIEWFALVSPFELQCWWAGQSRWASLDLPWLVMRAQIQLDSGLIRTYLVGFGGLVRPFGLESKPRSPGLHDIPKDDLMSVSIPRSRPVPLADREVAIPPLQNGDHLTRDEFMRRYEAMPELKKAELIEGVVFMGSPVSHEYHCEPHAVLIGNLYHYRAHRPPRPQ
jgi:hypothetical protein